METVSANNCAVASVNIYVRFLTVWGWTHAFYMIGGGVYVAFFGHSHFRPSLVVTLSFISFFVTMTIMCEMGLLNFWYTRQTISITMVQYLYTLLIVLVSFFLGGLLGQLISIQAGLVIMCILAGLMASCSLYIVYVSFAGNIYALIVMTTIAFVICSVLATKHKETMRVESTSFIGSYAIMRGVGMLIGGFPSEYQLFSWLF